MKKFWTAFAVIFCLAALILGFLLGTGRVHVPQAQKLDSLLVDQRAQDAQDPTFTAVEDLLAYQSKLIESYSLDSAFRAMPKAVLLNVSTVCLKKYGSINKKTILEEYNKNKDVYYNLPEKVEDNPIPPDTTGEQKLSKVYVDTVIDGKPAQLIKYQLE